MKFIATLCGLVLSIFFFDAVAPQEAVAAYSPKGDCRKASRTWRRKGGWGAFAVSRRGTACGWATGYPGKKQAVRAAIRKCRQLSRRCRVISVAKPPISTAKRISPAKHVSRLRGSCRKALRVWKRKDGYRAFALARDGSYCASSWDAASPEDAKKSALSACKAKVGCSIYDSALPRDLLKLRQKQLAELGLYKGKIDGIWGRGTRGAMTAFVQQAGHEKSDDDTAYQLLKWAALIIRGYDVTSTEAVKQAKRAAGAGSLAFMDKTARRLGRLALSPGDTRRVAKVVHALGLRSRGDWALGKGVWHPSFTGRGNPQAETIGRCRLATGGMVFAYYSEPSVGAIAVFDKPEFDRSAATATWAFDVNSTQQASIGRRGGIGDFVRIKDVDSFFEKIGQTRSLTMRSNGRGSARSFDVSNIKFMADIFQDCVRRAKLEPAPLIANTSLESAGSLSTNNSGSAIGKRNANGQFVFLTEINAEPVRMLFDTGATYVAINESLARKIGIRLKPEDFKHTTNTANGRTKFAEAVVDEMRVDGIVLNDVKISVLKDKSLQGLALLGMSFVGRLKRFEFEGETMKLTQ